MASAPSNLPASPTSFVGRAEELRALDAAFEGETRLVTLVGPGGIGKTRLARRFARRTMQKWAPPGGVWFVELSAAREAGDVLAAVAGVLGVRLDGRSRADDLARLGDALAAHEQVLVVLDTLEHLGPFAGELAARLLAATVEARLLVTSREPLRIDGEVRHELAPLRPEDARALLVQRAHAVLPGWGTRPEDGAVLEALAARLDALPLAIELAAPWAVTLAPAELLARLAPRLDLLQATRRDAPARHATMRAAIEWSWDLLAPWEADALARCSVFRGGFDADAFERVVALEPGGPRADEVLRALRERSLLRALEAGGATRFDLLDVIREFAAERLAGAGRRDEVVARHAAYYAELGGALRRASWLSGGRAAQQRLALERGNLLSAATEPAVDAPTAARAAVALERPLLTTGPMSLLHDVLAAVLERCGRGAPPALVADVEVVLGETKARQGHQEDAARLLETGRARAREAGAVLPEMRASYLLAPLLQGPGGRQRARALLEEAVQAFRAQEQDGLAALALCQWSLIDVVDARLDDARRHAEEALALAGGVAEATALGALGRVAAETGRTAEALALARRGLEALPREGDDRRRALLLAQIGEQAHILGDADQAVRSYGEAAEMLRRIGDRSLQATTRGGWSLVLLERSQAQEARALLEDAVRLTGRSHLEATLRAFLGAAEAELDCVARAREELAAAERAHARIDAPRFPGTLAACEGFLELAEARAAAAAGDAEAARARREAVRRRLAPASGLGSTDERLTLRILGRALERDERREAGGAAAAAGAGWRLRIEPAAAWFDPPRGGPRVDLARRAPLRRVLHALLERRLAAPGQRLGVDDVLAAGWPGEKVLADAATNRVYVAVATLRKLGLGAVLLTEGAGYLLDPAVPIEPGAAA